jgi:hypothetical protein
MNFSSLENVLWLSTFVGQVILLMVLLFRRRWSGFPFFVMFIGLSCIQDIGGFVAYSIGSRQLYNLVYWGGFVLITTLKIALVFEIARIVLRATGTWVRDARLTFFLVGLVGALAAFGLAYALHPVGSTFLVSLEIRVQLFASLLFCEIFLAMMFAANRLGLVWRNHVMGLGQGLGVWALISVGVDAAHGYFGVNHSFSTLSNVQALTFLTAVIYWTATFWFEEPERKPLSPEMQKYLVALHQKVQYDATQVSSMQNFR